MLIRLKLHQVGACLRQALQPILETGSLRVDVRVFMKQELHFVPVLQQLQHLPLQLCGSLLHHLVANHQRDLVGEALGGNLEKVVDADVSEFLNARLSSVLRCRPDQEAACV